MPPPNRGALIVLEGLDRAGKSTQHALLCARLESTGHKVERMRFPDRTTPTGALISTYLTTPTPDSQPPPQTPDQTIHLLFSANRWEAAPRIRALLAAGTTVVLDRYYCSGIVYTLAKQNPAISLEWARAPDVGLPKPDLCLFLDVGSEVVRGRGGFGGERYETVEMQERVRGVFGGLVEGEGMRVVDAGGTVEAVAEEIWGVVGELLGGEGLGGEVGRVEMK